jgi:hypothetical protein
VRRAAGCCRRLHGRRRCGTCRRPGHANEQVAVVAEVGRRPVLRIRQQSVQVRDHGIEVESLELLSALELIRHRGRRCGTSEKRWRIREINAETVEASVVPWSFATPDRSVHQRGERLMPGASPGLSWLGEAGGPSCSTGRDCAGPRSVAMAGMQPGRTVEDVGQPDCHCRQDAIRPGAAIGRLLNRYRRGHAGDKRNAPGQPHPAATDQGQAAVRLAIFSRAGGIVPGSGGYCRQM